MEGKQEKRIKYLTKNTNLTTAPTCKSRIDVCRCFLSRRFNLIIFGVFITDY